MSTHTLEGRRIRALDRVAALGNALRSQSNDRARAARDLATGADLLEAEVVRLEAAVDHFESLIARRLRNVA